MENEPDTSPESYANWPANQSPRNRATNNTNWVPIVVLGLLLLLLMIGAGIYIHMLSITNEELLLAQKHTLTALADAKTERDDARKDAADAAAKLRVALEAPAAGRHGNLFEDVPGTDPSPGTAQLPADNVTRARPSPKKKQDLFGDDATDAATSGAPPHASAPAPTPPATAPRDAQAWQNVRDAFAASDLAAAIRSADAYRRQHPSEPTKELDALIEDALDQLWWAQISMLCNKRDSIRAMIKAKDKDIREETSAAFRGVLTNERKELEKARADVQSQLNAGMGYALTTAPRVDDKELMKGLRTERDAGKFAVWKREQLREILAHQTAEPRAAPAPQTHSPGPTTIASGPDANQTIFGPPGGVVVARALGKGIAHRITFVCNSSGSMIEKMPALKDQLTRAIQRLDPSQSFEVIFFNEKCDSFVKFSHADGLVPANDETKRRFANFLNETTADGAIDPIPAIEMAFKTHPQLIYFLTCRDFPDDEALLKTIDELNKDEQVKIYTIAFLRAADNEPGLVTVLKQIAEKNRGNFRLVNVDQLEE